jgi:hypothetical protein
MHKWNKLYDYPKSVRELINSKRHYSNMPNVLLYLILKANKNYIVFAYTSFLFYILYIIYEHRMQYDGD